jgi:hypothetical protein
MTLPLFQLTPEEEAELYLEVGAERREREYAATQALLALGADFYEVEVCIVSRWPESSEPRYLKGWASESLGRLNSQRRGPLKAAGQER